VDGDKLNVTKINNIKKLYCLDDMLHDQTWLFGLGRGFVDDYNNQKVTLACFCVCVCVCMFI